MLILELSVRNVNGFSWNKMRISEEMSLFTFFTK